MTSALALCALDLVAVCVLALGLYWPRHRRRDLVVALVGINVGVLAVSALLASSAVTAGLGLGLFGVLSIIRLRSDELAQHEIAYYFASLALGLIGGIGITPLWIPAASMALVITTIALVDHPALLASHRRQVIVVDRALPVEADLRAHLSVMLGAEVTGIVVTRLDLVNDTTTVDVRYRLPERRASTRAGSARLSGTAAADGPVELAASERTVTAALPGAAR